MRAAIDVIEDEMLAVARADAAGTDAVVAENAARAAAGRARLTVRAARALCARFGGNWSGLRFLRLVKRLVRVDGAYWKMRDWNRGVARKRALLAAARENAKVREGLLGALGGERACERWERRAAGLGRMRTATRSGNTISARGRRLADEAPGQARGSGSVASSGRVQCGDRIKGGVEVRLPSLSRAAGRVSGHRSRSDGARSVRRSPSTAPVPVWPCEVLTNAAYDAMTARVRAAVAAKDMELAAMRASGREPAETRRRSVTNTGGTPRAGRPVGGVRAGGHASNEPLYAALHGKCAHP